MADAQDNLGTGEFIELAPPADKNWQAAIVKLDNLAKAEEGHGRMALVHTNKHRVEQGLVLARNEPAKGKRGDPSRTRWHQDVAKTLGCDDSYVRRLIATARTLQDAGLGERLPIEILDRRFDRVRSAATNYKERGDADLKPEKKEPAPENILKRLEARVMRISDEAHRVVLEAKALLAKLIEQGKPVPQKPFWEMAELWMGIGPVPLPDPRTLRKDGAATDKSAPTTVAAPTPAAVAATPLSKPTTKVKTKPKAGKRPRKAKPGTPKPVASGDLPKGIAVRVLKGKYAGYVGKIRFIDKKRGYNVRGLHEAGSEEPKTNSRNSARTWVGRADQGKKWELVK